MKNMDEEIFHLITSSRQLYDIILTVMVGKVMGRDSYTEKCMKHMVTG
jgi:hypothetical protein